MDDKIREVVEQYELNIKNVYRVRGAYILDTGEGLRILREFRSTEQKAEFAQYIKEGLRERGYPYTDLYLRNREGNLITENVMGNRYVLKHWFMGEECNLKSEKQVARAAENLGRLHIMMRGMTTEPMTFQADTFAETLIKHNRELRRVRSYIREKKQRNEFELLFLSIFSEFYQEAEDAESMLSNIDGSVLYQQLNTQQTLCHGSYNYHNILFTSEKIATTSFERAHLQLQVMDLYDFIRKLMEKNNWDFSLLQTVLDNYQKICPISKEEKKLLYIWLIYPEKFWKITNFYYNSKKTWMSGKNIEKLQGLQQQKKQRMSLLEKVPEILQV